MTECLLYKPFVGRRIEPIAPHVNGADPLPPENSRPILPLCHRVSKKISELLGIPLKPFVHDEDD